VADTIIRRGKEGALRYVRAVPGMTGIPPPVGAGLEVSRCGPAGA
jgi:hypothetical protein